MDRGRRRRARDDGTVHAPAITHDPSGTLESLYLLAAWDAGQNRNELRIFEIRPGPTGDPELVAGPIVSEPGWDWRKQISGDFAPQLGTSALIHTGDDRILDLQCRNGSLWATHTVLLPSGNNPTRASVQWWELDPAGVVIQRGLVDDPTGAEHHYYPSIAVNAAGQAMIGFTRSSPALHAEAAYVTSACDDPPGVTGDVVTLKAGEDPHEVIDTRPPFPRNRRGNYSATVVDPVDDLRLWTLQEYALRRSPLIGDRWSTWWGCVDRCSAELRPSCLSAIDGDGDGDGLVDPCDNCPTVANPLQAPPRIGPRGCARPAPPAPRHGPQGPMKWGSVNRRGSAHARRTAAGQEDSAAEGVYPPLRLPPRLSGVGSAWWPRTELSRCRRRGAGGARVGAPDDARSAGVLAPSPCQGR